MADALHISYSDYTVIRMPDGQSMANGAVTYTVFRPDGTSVCCGVVWSDLERLIAADELRRPRDNNGRSVGDA
jgi:hypothetical protein